MADNVYRCPFCKKDYINKGSLYSHMEITHKMMLNKLPPSQVYFNIKYKKLSGSCVVCKQPTSWNEKVERYERFCGKPTCYDRYKAEFRRRMLEKYGKIHLMDDPNFQKMLLSNRSISGTFKWRDKLTETQYTGSYELHFLQYLDSIGWEPKDVMSPAPQTFYYEYNNEKHFYIPDFYIQSMNLLVEIKDGGDNPNMHHKIQAVDKIKEQLKEDAVAKSGTNIHYLKVMNKEYEEFDNMKNTLKDKV